MAEIDGPIGKFERKIGQALYVEYLEAHDQRLATQLGQALSVLARLVDAYESITHDEYDGTSSLAARLVIADEARRLLEEGASDGTS